MWLGCVRSSVARDCRLLGLVAGTLAALHWKSLDHEKGLITLIACFFFYSRHFFMLFCIFPYETYIPRKNFSCRVSSWAGCKHVAHLWFLRAVCIKTHSAAVASGRATNLVTHPIKCDNYIECYPLSIKKFTLLTIVQSWFLMMVWLLAYCLHLQVVSWKQFL